MTTLRVVPAFDEVEHGTLGFGLGLESPPIEQLAFERREEALGHGVQRMPKAIEVYCVPWSE